MQKPVYSSRLTQQEIEAINSNGPFNHSVWSGRGEVITNEERLSGRGQLLADAVRRHLTEQFALEDMKSLSIVDVGCYDGWLLHELEDLPFQRLVGIEPREKNIRKGENVRRILGIESRVEFKTATIEDLKSPAFTDEFDVVLCMGVLHHLSSLTPAMESLRKICRKTLIVESLCLSNGWLTKGLLTELELKDVVYQFKPRIAGITGHKFESSYYDGSTAQSGVVCIPSPQTIEMHLDAAGFTKTQTLLTPKSYEKIFTKGGRETSAICLAAQVPEDSDRADTVDCDSADLAPEEIWARKYELELANTILPDSLIKDLYEHWRNGTATNSWNAWVIRRYCLATPSWSRWYLRFLRNKLNSKVEFEIVKNLRFNPIDKITLELAKTQFAAGRNEDVLKTLIDVTWKVNADSRSVYRAFCLLSLAHDRMGNSEQASRYHQLCLNANPLYPLEALRDNLLNQPHASPP